MQKSKNNEWKTTGGCRRKNRRNRNSYGSTSRENSTRKTQTKEYQNTSDILPEQNTIKNEPSGPNYASILYKKNDDKSIEDTNKSTTEYTNNFPIIQTFKPKTLVRNRIPRKNCNSSYYVWEQTYFRHILDLKDIFSLVASKLNIETESIDFLNVFAKFIRDCSSGEISPYIEDLTEYETQSYLNFIILRNEL